MVQQDTSIATHYLHYAVMTVKPLESYIKKDHAE